MRAYRTEGFSLRNSRRSQGWRRKVSQERGRRRLSAHLERLEDRAMMATIDVTTFTDVVDAGDGYISLREAITTANSNGANDTINLPAGTYTLSLTGTAEDNNVRGDLDVKESGKTITFVGAGSSSTIIDANDIDRVFDIFSGVTATFQGLTIKDGTPISSSSGGGIRSTSATLTLTNVVLTENATASNGANLYVAGGSATITNSTISSGDATSRGGGIYAINSATISLTDSSVDDNLGYQGAGIYLYFASLALDGASVTGNSSEREGAGIYIYGTTLSLDDCTISNNTAIYSGGGVYSSNAEVTIANSTIAGNSSDRLGGGLYVVGDNYLITNSSIYENVAQRGGGAFLYNAPTTGSVTGCIIEDNTATQEHGGGLYLDQNNSVLITVSDSTIRNNIALNDGGGGIYSDANLAISGSTISGNTSKTSGAGLHHIAGTSTPLLVTNSTFSGNSITGTSSYAGIGIYAGGGSSGVETLINVTVANNFKTTSGGGGGVYGGGNPTLYAKNSIFAGNTTNGSAVDYLGTLDSLGYNLIQNTTGATIVGTTTGNQLNVDPLLGSLQDNGGPTWTHALAYNSPALDAGTDTGAPSTDQRGVSRPQDGDNNATSTTDIGAYEFRYNHAPVNTVPGGQSTDEDTPLTFSSGNSNLISISDSDAGSVPVQVTLTGSNGAVTLSGLTGLTFSAGDGTADATMTFTGTITDINAALDGLQFLPTSDYSGSASLEIVTNDLNAGSDGSALSDTDNVSITVNAVNDAPVNSVPGVQTFDEDTTLTFSSGNGNLISISDVDAASSSVQVTLTVTHGTLTLSGTTGLTFTAGDGTSDATMTFTGTMTDINAALAGSVYTPTTDYYGSASLEIITNDQGNTGSGGAQSDTDSVEFTIEEVDSTPYVIHPLYDLLVVENAPNTFITLTPYFDDADIIPFSDSLTFTVQANDNTGLVTATIVGNVLKLVYDADETGVAEITIRATDEFSEYVDETFTVTVGSGCCGGDEEMEMMMGGGGESLLSSFEGWPGGFYGAPTSLQNADDCPGCPRINTEEPIYQLCCTSVGDAVARIAFGFDTRSGEARVDVPVGQHQLGHRGPDNPHPIISANYDLPGTVPLMLEAKLTLGGIEGESVYFDTSTMNPFDDIRISLQIDATELETGFYDYTIDFVEHFASSTNPSSLEGRYAIHNRHASEFGNRWWLTEIDTLDIQEDGVGWLRGNSTGAWFESDGFGGFEMTEVTFATLTQGEDDWYTVSTEWGERIVFDDCGRMRERIDANGNITYYAFWDALEDGSADEVAFITDPDGRTTSFFYTDGLLSSMTDNAGQVTAFTYVDGRLTTITSPDPDGEGPLAAPETHFTYTTEGWMESYTDADDMTASFEYDFAGRLSGGENPDGSTWALSSEIVQTLVDPASGYGTDTNPAPVVLLSDVHSEYIGPGGTEEITRTDKFGQPTDKLDANGNYHHWAYDDLGRLIQYVGPDPDGAGPLEEPETIYVYASDISLPYRIIHPDDTDEWFTYDSTYHRMTSHTDRLGRVTLWEIDSANGNVLSETRVVGELDDEINEETDDVVTTYTYTDGSGGIPAGMPLTITDPLGRVTLFNYYGDPESHDFARLHYVTVAYGEVGVAAATFFEYDAAGNVIEITDGLGRVTTYTYDALNRLVAMTQPDPDGAGALESPVWTYEYTAGGDLQFETDPLGNVLEYVYDDQHRVIGRIFADPDGEGPLESPEIEYTIDFRNFVTEITDALGRLTAYEFDDLGRLLSTTLPDPDGGGALTAPETTYTYDAVGNLATVTDALGNATSYRYDTMNRLVELTQPDPDGGGALTAPVTEYEYDDAGQLIAITDPLGRVTAYEYDTLGRLVKLTLPDPDGAGGDPAPETDYAYDKAGNLLSVTDSLGNVTTYAYDARNRLLSVTQPDPDGGGALAAPETTYTYDAASQLLTVTDPLGRETSYDYDGLGRLVSVTLPDPDGGGPLESPVTTFAYDAVGNLLVETDALGNETAYAYDNLYRLIEVTQADPDGGGAQTSPVTTYEYDVASQLLSVTDPLGRETTYTYDNLGRQLTITQPDPDGGGAQTAPVTTFEYDAVSNLLSVTDALGNETAYAYDDLHRLLTVTQADPDGGGAATSPVTTYEYDSASQLVGITDPLGRETAYAYDGLGRRISVTQPDPDGGGAQTSPVSTFEYDAVGNLLVAVDPLGNETAYDYDNLYRLIEVTQADPDGGGAATSPITTYEYDSVGQLLSMTDPLGRETSYDYDNLGRRIEMTQPDPDGGGGLSAPVWGYSYDAVGNLLVATDPLDNETEYEYDNLYRLLTVTQADPDGGGAQTSPVTTYEYDSASQLLSTIDPLGRETSYGYDALGRQITMTQPDPDGVGGASAPVWTYEYDAVGNRLTVIDPLANETEYAYDNLYRQTRQTDANGAETDFTYDAVGNLLTLTDPEENTTTWVYDNLNRAIEETNELSDTRYFTFDAAGNLVEKTDRNGRVTEYEYDDLHRLVEERWMDGVSTLRTLSFAYDSAGQLTAASDPSASYDYTYDALGRATSIVQDIAALPEEIEFVQEFDAVGNRLSLAATIGATADFASAYTYDDLHRLTRIEQADQSGGYAVAEKRIDFAYNAAGQFDTITRFADLAGTDLVVTTSYAYDGIGRIDELLHEQDTTTLAGYEYAWDAASRITAITNVVYAAESATYTYDDRGQLTAADRTGSGSDEAYVYDTNGNRDTANGETYAVDPNNQIQSDGTFDYLYDAEGNRTRKTEIATDDYVTYTWDYRNRLTDVRFYDDSDVLQKHVAYAYDAFDRRIVKQVDADGDSDFDAAEAYVYDGAHVALRFVDPDGDGAADSSLANRYVHGPVIDQVLADEQVHWDAIGEDYVTDDLYWPLADHLGTVRDIAEYNPGTDTTSVANHLTIDSFGRITAETNSAVDHLFAFTGRERDDDAGLHYYRARWYDPSVGQFVSQDPIGFRAHDPSLYRYTANMPTVLTDPTGLQPPVYGPPTFEQAAEQDAAIFLEAATQAVEAHLRRDFGINDVFWHFRRQAGIIPDHLRDQYWEFAHNVNAQLAAQERIDRESPAIFGVELPSNTSPHLRELYRRNSAIEGLRQDATHFYRSHAMTPHEYECTMQDLEMAQDRLDVEIMAERDQMSIGWAWLNQHTSFDRYMRGRGDTFQDVMQVSASMLVATAAVGGRGTMQTRLVNGGFSRMNRANPYNSYGPRPQGTYCPTDRELVRQAVQQWQARQQDQSRSRSTDATDNRSFIDDMSSSEAAKYREYWGGKHDLSGGQPFGVKTTVTAKGELKTVTTYDQHGRPHRQYGLREGELPHEHGFTYPQTPLPGTGYTPIRGPQRPIGSNE